jgi:hypothetical protein
MYRTPSPLGLTAGLLEIAPGASHLTIDAANLVDELYRADFDGPQPTVEVKDGQVRVRYRLSPVEWIRRALFEGGHGGHITLNTAVPWRIAVRGGASTVSADLTGLRVDAIEVRGGASDLLLALGRPSGTVPLHISGGASDVLVRRPSNVPVRVLVRGGLSDVAFDDGAFGAVSGPTRLQSPGWDEAHDRYDVEISGGASDLAVLGDAPATAGSHSSPASSVPSPRESTPDSRVRAPEEAHR